MRDYWFDWTFDWFNKGFVIVRLVKPFRLHLNYIKY